MGTAMSLINKVLKDLESRERTSGDRPSSPMLEDLRSAPTPEKRVSVSAYGWALAAVLAGALLVAAGVEYGQRTSASHAARTDLVVAKEAPPVPRPAPALVIASSSPAAVVGGAAVKPRPVGPKAPAAKARTRVAPAPRASAPRPVVVPKRTLVSRVPATFHFSGDGISRRAAPMTPAEQSAARYRLAIAALRQGRAGAARRDLKAALGFVPGAARPTLLLAGLDIRNGQLKVAQQVLAKALAAHPDGKGLIMLLAQVDLRMGQATAALAVLAKVPPQAQTEPYWALLAASKLRAGNRQAAVRAYEQGLQRFAESGSLWVGLGLADSESGHSHAARLAFLRAQRCALSPVLARFVQQELSALP